MRDSVAGLKSGFLARVYFRLFDGTFNSLNLSVMRPLLAILKAHVDPGTYDADLKVFATVQFPLDWHFKGKHFEHFGFQC